MLFCVVSPVPGRSRHPLAQRRKAIVQLSLMLLEPAVPQARVWEALTPEQRAAAIEILGRLVAKAAVAAPSAKDRRDE
jgi:hypothetical protein